MADAPFSYTLVRTYFDGDLEERLSAPLGCSIELDDFQVHFDHDAKQLRINLSGQQATRVKMWGWLK